MCFHFAKYLDIHEPQAFIHSQMKQEFSVEFQNESGPGSLVPGNKQIKEEIHVLGLLIKEIQVVIIMEIVLKVTL